MEYFLEVSRIVEGAARGNRRKVAMYVEQLARKLTDAGDEKSARRLLQALEARGVSDLATASLSPDRRMPVDSESRLALADEQWLSPEDEPVVLSGVVENRVREFINFVRAADHLVRDGVGLPASMLILGPPGVGKTALARHIAARLDLPLIVARIDSIISSFLGSTAKNLRILFEHAMDRPCVLFLDELDALAKLRDDPRELGELKRVVVSLLQNIDGLDNKAVLLAATNHSHLLDPAIWRRFSYRLEIGVPDLTARQHLFQLFLREHAAEVQTDLLASASEGLTGADIKEVCWTARRQAIVDGGRTVRIEDLLRNILYFRMGASVDFGTADEDQVRAIHGLDPRVFTCRRIALLFGTSDSTISRRLSQGGIEHGGSGEAASQGHHPARR